MAKFNINIERSVLRVEITKTKLDGVFVIEPKVFGDHRGWFMESYLEMGLNINFLQDN